MLIALNFLKIRSFVRRKRVDDEMKCFFLGICSASVSHSFHTISARFSTAYCSSYTIV